MSSFSTIRFSEPGPLSLIAGALLLGIAVLYWLALPRPIPGIPYHKTSARSILGDLPSLIRTVKQTQENIEWMTQQCGELNSPIVQLFLKPLSKPMVVISDFREAEDIALRRTREFDRAKLTSILFEGLIPQGTICMPSHDKFKNQRRIWAVTMSTTFLNDVAAPHIHEKTTELLELWRCKTELAKDHAFQADEDIRLATLDVIWKVTLGSELHGISSQIDNIRKFSSIDLPVSSQDPVKLPRCEPPELYQAIIGLLYSLVPLSPLPSLHHWLVRKTPHYRRIDSVRERTLNDLLRDSRNKFSTPESIASVKRDANAAEDGEGEATTTTTTRTSSAMEHVLRRIAAADEKSNTSSSSSSSTSKSRTPSPMAGALKNAGMSDAQMKDELFTFLLAGHETTATTLSWAMKYLADNPVSQSRLRHDLQAAFPAPGPPSSSPSAFAASFPSAHAILTTDIPYLDATIAELLRITRTAPAFVREATVATEILGFPIPKGTTVLCSTSGFNYLFDDAELAPSEDRRSATSRKARGGPQVWQAGTMREYAPERWLERRAPQGEKDGDGKESYNANAGPSLPFSAGPRGCFGKKLALLELRVILVLVVLAFELKKAPEGLSGYLAKEVVTRQPRSCYVRLERVR